MDKAKENKLIRENILKTPNAFKSIINSNHPYKDLIYGDSKNKLCIAFSPRAGCSISFQCYLDIIGLLNDGIKYNSFIHRYRTELFNKRIKKRALPLNYTYIKFIMNPYTRAVSIYRAQTSHNLSFREYLKQHNTINLNNSDKYHRHSQYIPGEEAIPFVYIKIDKNETHQLGDYTIDPNKYTSVHHGKKTSNTDFCGDIPRQTVNQQLPSSYKYFYDEEIKSLVYQKYKQDIDYYKYSFEDIN